MCLQQLFYLSVEAYLGSSNKEARALAPQICSHFLEPDAVSTVFSYLNLHLDVLDVIYLFFLQALKIKVREEYLTDIGGTSSYLDPDGLGRKSRSMCDRTPVCVSPQRVGSTLRKTSADRCRNCSSRSCRTSRTRYKTTGRVRKRSLGDEASEGHPVD